MELSILDLVKLLRTPNYAMYISRVDREDEDIVKSILVGSIHTLLEAEIYTLNTGAAIRIFDNTELELKRVINCIYFKDRDVEYRIELRPDCKQRTIAELLQS